MAIISEYEEDSEDVETIVRANSQDGDDGYDDEDEDYPPDPYASSRPSDATCSERPYDEVLGFLLREHQHQPLELLSTVVEFLFRETGIAGEEGVDVRLSEMLSAAKRRRIDAEDVEDAFGGPDKIAKLDEIFDNPEAEDTEPCLRITILESTQGSSPKFESFNKQQNSVEDEETVISTPAEHLKAGICEEDSQASTERKNLVHVSDDDEKYLETVTAIITPGEDVTLISNLAFDPDETFEINPADEKVADKCTKANDLGNSQASQRTCLDPNSGNGAELETYSWKQSPSADLCDTTFHFPVSTGANPKSIVRGVQARYLKVELNVKHPFEDANEDQLQRGCRVDSVDIAA